jgi:histone acetyltransferase HTATIP
MPFAHFPSFYLLFDDTSLILTLKILRKRKDPISVNDLAEMTSIKQDDIISTLYHLNIVRYYKAQNCILLPDDLMKSHEKSMTKKRITIDPSCLQFTPVDWAKRGAW